LEKNITGIKPTAKKRCNGRNIKENNDIINKTDQGIRDDACLIAAAKD
jgi:hypothetical protein